MISVIASTLRGVEYLTQGNNFHIIRCVIRILKESELGSVTQRFCIAILQKSSVKENAIPTIVDKGMINWILDLLESSLDK
jgi:hypothetical protein